MLKYNNKYDSYITKQYYLFWVRGLFCDQFIKFFFQLFKIENMLIKF